MGEDNFERNSACANRIVIGLLTVAGLHFTLYFVGSVATGIWEREHGVPVIYGDSPLLGLLCGCALLAVIWRGKPRLVDWAAPFTLWAGYWFMQAVATNFHPDTTEEAGVAAFSLAMFLACLCLWSLALLIALVRWGLKLVGVTQKA